MNAQREPPKKRAIDLREVSLPAGVTTLRVRAVFGAVEITVPPSLIVECAGTGVLGSFTGVNHVREERADDEPVLSHRGQRHLRYGRRSHPPAASRYSTPVASKCG